ncbi:MAG: hypothetical protein Q8904_01730 [Bacteroidota bacterium]|nr:hypothetical protein [Bacteroidota bacterium]
MKSTTLFLIAVFFPFISLPIRAQDSQFNYVNSTNTSGSLTQTSWVYPFYVWFIQVPANSAISVHCTSSTVKLMLMSDYNNGNSNVELFDNSTATTLSSQDGYISIYADESYGTPLTGNVFTISYQVDSTYTNSQNVFVTGKEIVAGDLDVYGKISASTISSSGSMTASSLYTGDMYADNSINCRELSAENIYVTGDQGTIGFSSSGLVKELGSNPAWAVGKGNYHSFGKMSTPSISDWQGNYTEQMRIDSTGNVGIGTSKPYYKLEIFKSSGSQLALSTNNNGADFSRIDLDFFIHDTDQTAARISSGYNYTPSGAVGALRFFTSYPNQGLLERMRIHYNGNVGIGMTEPNYLLDVNGTIHAREVIVDIAFPPADYVFKSTYKLMPLSEVEKYVKAHCHLPEIKSASEITKNGLSMGEMQNKLLQKIEELTLYLIEQQKEINELKQELKR